MSLRYRFVQAFINDVNVGIYAIEENFETELIENNEKRAGVAFRFNCSKYWHYKYGITSDRLLGAPIEPYDVGDESLDNPIYRQFLVAKSMVEKWSEGKAQLDEVFDIDLLAKYFSVVDLYGGQHGAWIDNMKFYYNPVTSLIEPIGHDNSTMINLATSEPIDGRKLLGERRHISNGTDKKTIDRTGTDFINIWYNRIFENRQFYEKYVESLWEISDPVWINNFTDSISPSVKAYQSLLQKNIPDYEFDGMKIVRANAKFIRGYLSPVGGIESFIGKKDTAANVVQIQIRNTHYAPFLVTSITYKDSVIHSFEEPLLIQGHGGSSNSEVTFELVVDSELLSKKKFVNRIGIEYRMLGGRETFVSEPFPWDANSMNLSSAILNSRKPNYQNFAFIHENQDILTISEGNWVVEGVLTIDKSKTLQILPGANIQLQNGGAILCYGAVNFVGTTAKPINVIAKDSGQGILVIDSKKRSTLKGVQFYGLQRFKIDNWELPSAVTFYNSNVDISDCRFENNRLGDDYLNIFRSEFTLMHSDFIDCFADAFDGDFVNGKIQNVTFTNVGNDGIDFSGSSIKLHNVTFRMVADKAISAGERSQISASNVKIIGCELGVNSKDASNVSIKNSRIDSTRIPLIAFMKKEEFGPSAIYATGLNITNYETKYLLESSSVISIDGEKLSSTHSDLKSLLYGVEYGKSSH